MLETVSRDLGLRGECRDANGHQVAGTTKSGVCTYLDRVVGDGRKRWQSECTLRIGERTCSEETSTRTKYRVEHIRTGDAK